MLDTKYLIIFGALSCNGQTSFSTFGATTSKNQEIDPEMAKAQPQSALVDTATQNFDDDKVQAVAVSEEANSLRFEFAKSDCNIRFRPIVSIVTTDNLGNNI